MSVRTSPCSLRLAMLSALCCAASSCKEDGPYHKETIHVSGQIVVDGQPPGAPVQIMAHDLGEVDTEHPSVSQGISENDGKFSMTTYETGDGMPPGEYALTFTLQELNAFTMSYSGVDKLNGRYSDPKTSTTKVTIKSGDEPKDLGRIELTTK